MRANRPVSISRRGFLLGAAAMAATGASATAQAGIATQDIPRVSLPDLPIDHSGAGYETGAAWAQQLWGGSLLGSPGSAISGGGIAATVSAVQDRTVLEITLRVEALFSNGVPVTGPDVVASLEHARERSEDSGAAWRWEHVQAFEAAGDRMARIVLHEPDASLAATLATHWAPIFPAEWIRNGWIQAYGPYPPASGAFVRIPAGGNRITCLRNTAYYQIGRPRIPGVVCVPPSPGISRVVELATGAVDLLIDAPLLEVPTLRENPGVVLAGGAANALCMLAINLQGPVLSDRRVRRLLDRAIDRKAVAGAAAAGEATPATTLINPAHWAGLDLPLEPLDPTAVRTELDALGVEPGHELRLLVDERDGSMLNAAILLQDQLAYLGFSVSLQLLHGDVLERRTRSGDWDLRIVRTPFWHDPHELVRPLLVSGAGDNLGGYANRRLDYLTDLARRARSEAFRRDHYRTIQEIVRDDVPLVPLYFPHYFDAMSTRLQGYQAFPPISSRAMNQVVMPRLEPEATP